MRDKLNNRCENCGDNVELKQEYRSKLRQPHYTMYYMGECLTCHSIQEFIVRKRTDQERQEARRNRHPEPDERVEQQIHIRSGIDRITSFMENGRYRVRINEDREVIVEDREDDNDIVDVFCNPEIVRHVSEILTRTQRGRDRMRTIFRL